jgi:hypothetical protein
MKRSSSRSVALLLLLLTASLGANAEEYAWIRVSQEFKKSPENPFNQATVAFDATKEEKVEALRKLREETETRCVRPALLSYARGISLTDGGNRLRDA